MTTMRAACGNAVRPTSRSGYPGGGGRRAAGADASAGLARDAEAEGPQRLDGGRVARGRVGGVVADQQAARARPNGVGQVVPDQVGAPRLDRKSTRLNSSHVD